MKCSGSIAADSMDVSLARVRNLDIDPRVSEAYLYTFAARTFGFDAQLVQYSAPSPVTGFKVDGEKYYRFTADSALVFLKPAAAHSLRCQYRLSQTYYDTGIRSAGIRFAISWVNAAGAAHMLWAKDVDPKQGASAYEEAVLELALPQGEGRLMLEVTGLSPGEKAQLLLRDVCIK